MVGVTAVLAVVVVVVGAVTVEVPVVSSEITGKSVHLLMRKLRKMTGVVARSEAVEMLARLEMGAVVVGSVTLLSGTIGKSSHQLGPALYVVRVAAA